MKNDFWVVAVTVAAVGVAGLSWLIIYSLSANKATGFNGQAEILLYFVLLIAALVGGTGSASYSVYKKHLPVSEALGIAVCFGLLMVAGLGFVLSHYASDKYPGGQTDPTDNVCQNEFTTTCSPKIIRPQPTRSF